jgi:hypothetical protein
MLRFLYIQHMILQKLLLRRHTLAGEENWNLAGRFSSWSNQKNIVNGTIPQYCPHKFTAVVKHRLPV